MSTLPASVVEACLFQLPNWTQVKALPLFYEDSTHHLFIVDTPIGKRMLKCQRLGVESRGFWQEVGFLFGIDLKNHSLDYAWVAEKLASLSPLAYPKVICSERQISSRPAYVLTEWVDGMVVDPDQLTQDDMANLAKHSLALHKARYVHYGRWREPMFEPNCWGLRLASALTERLNEVGLLADYAQEVELAYQLQPEYSVPVMLDFRWDQCLIDANTRKITIVDLDAFVLAPVELDWIILELVLNEQQAHWYKAAYLEQGSIPDLSTVRRTYRLWLYFLNLLGESDLQAWLNRPAWFDR